MTRLEIYTDAMEKTISAFYRPDAGKRMDAAAIASGISGRELMQRAADACWTKIMALWPQVEALTIICGSGNNGGDGYDIAALAQRSGKQVRVFEMAGERIGDALLARQRAEKAGCRIQLFEKLRTREFEHTSGIHGSKVFINNQNHVVVDAVFGIGLNRDVNGEAREMIETINQIKIHGSKVFSVDIPSGLNAENGQVMGVCVNADATLTVIAAKSGLVLAQAKNHTGALFLDDLDVSFEIANSEPPEFTCLTATAMAALLPRHTNVAHKGNRGRILIIGGTEGFTGAALMAAKAALRSGAGLVTVACAPSAVSHLALAQPELMTLNIEDSLALRAACTQADVIAIGPGLGQSECARQALSIVLDSPKIKVMDADALNLLAQQPQKISSAVITPHPGEAARLLGLTTQHIQNERLDCVRKLAEKYECVAILKGAGSLVCADGKTVEICIEGNPGMAVGGMGDVLSGIVAALMGQGASPENAAKLGTWAHAKTADTLCNTIAHIGYLPTDVIEALPRTFQQLRDQC